MNFFKVLRNFTSTCSKKLTFGRAKPSKTSRKIINKLNREVEAESRRPIRKGRNRTESTCWTILLIFAFFMTALLISIAINGRLKKKDRNCLDCQELESFGLEEIEDLAFSHHFFPEKDNNIVERYDAHKEELGQLIPLEQGKLLKEAIGEVSYGASFIEFFAEEAKSVYGDIILATLRQALESEAVMGRFHAVYDKLNQALDDVSYDELGISVEVKEQVELMCMQLKRAKRGTDTQDIELAMDLMVVFSEDDRNADSAVLERLANKLELHSKADLKAETLAVRKLVKERGGQNADSIQQIIDLLANHPANQQIKAGIIPSLLHLLEDKSLGMVDEALSILQLLLSHPEARNEIGRLLFVETLVEIIKNGTPKNKECAKSVLLELGLNNSSCILAAVQFGVYEHLIEMTPFCSS